MHDDGSVTDSERPLSRSSSGSLCHLDFTGLVSPTAAAAGNDAVPCPAGYVDQTHHTSCRRRRSKPMRSLPKPANWEAAWGGNAGVTAVKDR